MSDGPRVPRQNQAFVEASTSEWKTLGPGVQRQVLAHGPDLMLVRVKFVEGAVGAVHHHPHRQATYVAEGSFEATVDGTKQTLRKGDTFFAAENVPHSVVALENGMLLDCFTPARADFLDSPAG